ncbi:2-succinyl-5-enolpyruvyl-6-hydroxy-3-cyclohexene-1-carboxylic-acid synthase [Pseudonocardiaceae bacterium YIM PH 21723]|nr:2-succinyl-5-enolpyruvyl-6-hydroxy-3-cyclohexene-1-carboxylic-acid synthase [Pseudonocardiaceae bacterium YIM PH 21723]
MTRLSGVNPSAAAAAVVVDELIRAGVRHAVLVAGPRNAPLAIALNAADRAGRITLHVRIDLRSAAFLALGLAQRTLRPVPVVGTDAESATHALPALRVAEQTRVPLVLLTAEAEWQEGTFGPLLPTVDLGMPRREPGRNAAWRSTVNRVLATATGVLDGYIGPAHLNLPFATTVEVGDAWPDSLDGRPDGRRWTTLPVGWRPQPEVGPPLDKVPTLVVAGPGANGGIALLAAQYNWPLIAEPGSPSWGAPGVIAGGGLLLGAPNLPEPLRPARIVVAGRPEQYGSVRRWLADPEVEVCVLADSPLWPDQAGTADRVLRSMPAAVPNPQEWLADWHEADRLAGIVTAKVLGDLPWWSGLRLARTLVAAIPVEAQVSIGDGEPLRDVTQASGPRDGLRLMPVPAGGGVAAAIGAALAHDGPAYALLGERSLLEDAGALLIGGTEQRPPLTLVVRPDVPSGGFERLFGIPATRLPALAAASGIEYRAVSTEEEFVEALDPTGLLRIVHVIPGQEDVAGSHGRLYAAIAAIFGPVA